MFSTDKDIPIKFALSGNFLLSLGRSTTINHIVAKSAVICLCVHTSGCTDFFHNTSPCPHDVLITDIKLCSMIMVELISLPVIDIFHS